MDYKVYLSIGASVLGLIFGLVVYIWTRTIGEYDRRFADHDNKIECLRKYKTDLADRLSHLEGEHEVETCKARRKK